MMSVLEVATARSMMTRANFISRQMTQKDNEVIKHVFALSKLTINLVLDVLLADFFPF